MQFDADAVGTVLREVAETIIAPRFQALASEEIEEKSPGEIVTIADRQAEDAIRTRLQSMLPGVPVVGEEAVEDDPALLDAVAIEPAVWLVDPLDGTANFANGNPHWATMIALVREGQTVASWIYRHTDRCLYAAERGAGAWCGETRLQCEPGAPSAEGLRGAVLPRFLTDAERDRMVPRFDRFAEVTGGFVCAGYEYPAIIEGAQDFALFQRLLPWDHAPGVLLLEEAGGVARRPDGRAYRPADRERGLLLASSEAVWIDVHRVLYAS